MNITEVVNPPKPLANCVVTETTAIPSVVVLQKKLG